MTKVLKLLVKNMKRNRERLGISQYELAELLDVSSDTVAKIESGKRFPSEKTLDKLATVFTVEPYQLFIDNDEPFDKQKFINKVYPLITDDILKRLQEGE